MAGALVLVIDDDAFVRRTVVVLLVYRFDPPE
jgi:hypothetical protein